MLVHLLMVGGAANQQNATDSAPKQQSSFERIVERMSVEYPTYTRYVAIVTSCECLCYSYTVATFGVVFCSFL